MKKIRENIINLLKKGDLPSNAYINYYDKVKNIKFKYNKFLEKNIEALKNYYPNALNAEKGIINNVLFILETFTSKENALKNYLFRSLHFKHDIKDVFYSLDFFQKTPSLTKEIFLNTLNKILNPDYFFSLNEQTRRNIFINILAVWHNKNIFVKPFWLEQLPLFKKLIDSAITKDLIEDIMYIHFYYYHFYGNSSQTIKDWEKFNEIVEKPLSKYYRNWGKKNNLPKPPQNYNNKKKRIGFLIDRLVTTSPLMVEYSLWKELMDNNEFKNNYKIFVYSMNYVDKNPDEEEWVIKLKKIGIEVYTPQFKFYKDGYYYKHLPKALDLREQILKDKIDILVSGFGYDIPNFLFSTKTAPKQIFWSHGNCTSEIENIDLRISHFEQECKNYEWKIFNVPMAEEFLIGPEYCKIEGKKIKENLLQKYGKNTVILGTIGRLIKIDSEEYIKVLAEIMKQNPNTIYLACGEGNQESIKKKLKKYNINENRFIFTGQINPHIYGWVIDIWPDTFPLRQGHSIIEAQAKGVSLIHYGPNYTKEDLEKLKIGYNYGFKQLNIKLFYPIANDKNKYVKIANFLIKIKDKRLKIAKAFQIDILKNIESNFIEKVINVN
ncbi:MULTISPECIES: hypothetical protein [unclassified Lebetimonas]|uniref:hypothetical protein n=1 Tax=unclassified Lebetimonas TaxID=2648158 RepID=UPI0004662B2A|nr:MULTISPECIES: hypothetical protein [unclassified Lebetimonas]